MLVVVGFVACGESCSGSSNELASMTLERFLSVRVNLVGQRANVVQVDLGSVVSEQDIKFPEPAPSTSDERKRFFYNTTISKVVEFEHGGITVDCRNVIRDAWPGESAVPTGKIVSWGSGPSRQDPFSSSELRIAWGDERESVVVLRWYREGVIHEQFVERNGTRDGPYARWDDMGNLIEQGEYRSGEKFGTWFTASQDDGPSKEQGTSGD